MIKKLAFLFPIAAAGAFTLACTEDKLAGPGDLVNQPNDAGADTTVSTQSICLTVGNGDATAGAAAIDGVVDQFLTKVTADCKINGYFSTLTASGVTHLSECLKIQVEELFGCPDVKYAGSKDKAGVACRDMVAAHQGLKITEPDYDALITDLVSVIPDGVKAHPDFAGIAAALTAPKTESTSFKSAIIEDKASTTNPKAACTDAGTD